MDYRRVDYPEPHLDRTRRLLKAHPEVKALFDVPAELAVAGLIALGRPVRQPRRLSRRPVHEFATVDSFTGPPSVPPASYS